MEVGNRYPTVYYRESLMDEEEWDAIVFENFFWTPLLSKLEANHFVIPRYSVLPFAKDLYNEFAQIGCGVINTLRMHEYTANMKDWYWDLKDLTPATYDALYKIPPEKHANAFVLKGATNSRKSQWNTHMFAENYNMAQSVFAELADDSLIGQQQIYIREFVPLHTYLKGINGLPITKEFRVFFYKDQVLAKGFYWQNYVDDIGFTPDANEIPYQLLEEVGRRLGRKVNFYVVDIAQTVEGKWIVVEVNDGCMSGLACVDPNELYGNLYKLLTQ